MTAVRVLGLDAVRWRRVGPGRLLGAGGLAVGASGLFALNRFGGVAVDEPRAFLRMALVGVWGWLGLGTVIWLIEVATRRLTADGDTLLRTVNIVGVAHGPVLTFGLIVLVSAGMLDFLGPGLIAAWFVFGAWFPAQLVVGVRQSTGSGLRAAMATAGVPYLLWLHFIGRHLLDRVQHLL